MLAIENALLLAKGWCIAALLSGGFMLLLNRAIASRLGHITLPVPYALLVGITAAVCAAMALMTFLCYRFSDRQIIVEDIRRETV
jgi:type III secretory pathway component EscT